jgi:hypothetical protein
VLKPGWVTTCASDGVCVCVCVCVCACVCVLLRLRRPGHL